MWPRTRPPDMQGSTQRGRTIWGDGYSQVASVPPLGIVDFTRALSKATACPGAGSCTATAGMLFSGLTSEPCAAGFGVISCEYTLKTLGLR